LKNGINEKLSIIPLIKRQFMGFWQNQKNKLKGHADRHIFTPAKNMRYANSQYKENMEKGKYEQAREWQKERNKHLMKLTKTTAVVGGAAYAGRKIAGAPKAGAQKIGNVAQNQYQAIKQGGAYDFMILWTLVLYFFLSRFYRANLVYTIAVHAIIILIVVVGVLPRSEKNKETYVVMGMILLIEVALPYFIYQLPFLMANKFIVNYLINPQVTMLWFYFAVMRSSRQSIISKTAYFLVWAIWLGILLSFVATSLSVEDVKTALTPEQLAAGQSIYTKAFTFWKDAVTHVGDIMEQGRRYWTNQMRYATGGDYYTGAVDENQQETLGVFLEDLKPSDNEFYTTDTISVSGTLKAKTLEDGLKIYVACYHGRKNKDGNFDNDKKGKIYPNSSDDTVVVYDKDTLDIDCRFPSGSGMEEGSTRITIQADFNFETMAYLKTYFMDKDRIRSMQNQGIDPLGYYGIEDKNPIARYTNGPVQIGVGIGEDSPIGIRDKYSVKPRIGITLMTNEAWEGKIKQLEQLIVMVPDSMSLDLQWCPEFEDIKTEDYEEDCIKNYKKYRSTQLVQCAEKAGLNTQTDIDADGNVVREQDKVESCMNDFCKQEIENYRAYRLKIDNSNKKLYSNIGYDADERDHKTFSCRINVDEPSNILGDAPVAIHYFRAKARYTYEIENYVNVDLKKGEEIPIEYTIPKPPRSDNIKEQMSFIYNEFERKEPYYIKKWCEATGLLGNIENCSCLLASIMSVESGGDVRIKDGDGGISKFLMQIKEDTAKGVWKKYQLEPCDLHKIDCNIMSAAYYLKSIEDGGKTQDKVENYAAAYNCGPKALFPTKDCDGLLNWQCPTEKNDNNRKCLNNKTKEMITRNNYVPKFSVRYEMCKNLNLQTKYTVLPPTDNFVGTGNVALSFDEYGKMETTIPSTPYVLLFSAEPEETSDVNGSKSIQYSDYSVTIYYKKTDNDKFKLTGTIDLEDGIGYDKDFPLINFKRTGMNVEYSYLMKAVSKEVTLIKDLTIPTAGEDVEKHTVLFDGWLEAYYNDNDIELYDKTGNKFCTVSWDNYNNRLNGICDEEELFMFKIANINTIEKDRSLDKTIIGSEKRDTATIQLQYDPNREHDCCSDCSTCKNFGEGLIPCSTCKNCVPKIILDSVVCESSTKSTSDTTSSTQDTKQEPSTTNNTQLVV